MSKQQTIVTFCTGGIRCEKAALYLQHYGFKTVYQLHGGILRYLKETDGTHWHGECFVFDERVSLDKNLLPTFRKLCLSCQARLDQTDSTLCMRCTAVA